MVNKILSQLNSVASQAYSRGELSGENLGLALNDLVLPDSEGHIVMSQADMGLFYPLATAITLAAGNGLSLRLVINQTNHNLLIGQFRASFQNKISLGTLDPNSDTPYTEYLQAMNRAGDILIAKAAVLLTREQVLGVKA